MQYLHANLNGIRRTFPELVSALEESSGGRLTISSSREGSPTAKQEEHWIHSAYDPRKEARTWAELQAKEWQAGELGVVLGTAQINMLMHNTFYVPGHFHATVVGGTSLSVAWSSSRPNSGQAAKVSAANIPKAVLRILLYMMETPQSPVGVIQRRCCR